MCDLHLELASCPYRHFEAADGDVGDPLAERGDVVRFWVAGDLTEKAQSWPTVRWHIRRTSAKIECDCFPRAKSW